MSFTMLLSGEAQQFERQQLSQQYQQQQPPKLLKISDNDALMDTLTPGQQFDHQQLPQQYEQQQPSRLWRISGNDTFATTGTSIKEQIQDSVSTVQNKPTGFLMYIPATSPDTCTMVENMCMQTLSRQQVTTYEQRVNHESIPFPSLPYSPLQLTLSKFAAFSDNCQPRVDNESAVSVIPEQPLNSTDPQQQLNGSRAGNIHGNSEPRSPPATYASTNGTGLPDPSTTSSCQPLSPSSPTQPSQSPQLVQPAQPIGTGSATSDKYHSRVPCTCPNCYNGVNDVRNQDQTIKEKQHICHYPGCGKVFKWPTLLLVHLRRHSGEKQFICNWLSCGKRFVTLKELQQHRYIHTSENNYMCEECSKKFKCRAYLKQHAKTHLKTQKKARQDYIGKTICNPGNSSSSSSLLQQN